MAVTGSVSPAARVQRSISSSNAANFSPRELSSGSYIPMAATSGTTYFCRLVRAHRSRRRRNTYMPLGS